MGDVKWIKLSTGLPDNRKIRQIRKLPAGDTIALMWVFLMCLAGETNEDGMVYFTPGIPYTEEMLADEFRMELNTVRLALATFQRFGMIEIVDDIICLSAWEKWQSTDSLATIREQTRKRVAKHRQKQKLLASNVTSNVTVTACNATEEEKEEDKKEDKKENKSVRETTHTLFLRLLPDYVLSDSLQAKMGEWVKYKTERKEPYKEQGMKSLLRQVENKAMEYGDDAVCSLIDECMANNWKGIIFNRLQQNQRKPASGSYHRRTKAEELDDFYTMAENWSET